MDAARRCRIGSIELRLGEPGPPGIQDWALRGLAEEAVLRELPTRRAEDARPASAPSEHPNGALVVDHVVAGTPDLARTIAALEAAGLECRRVRRAEARRHQAFFAVGEALLEVIGPAEPSGAGAARFWGVAVAVADLDAAAATLGDLLDRPHAAVQPGRRIATAAPAAGPGAAVALMTPRVDAD